MKSFVRREALCPFYHREEDRRLFCEGPEADIHLQLIFPRRKAFESYLHRLCCLDWDRCRIAQMLERKYEEREETESNKSRGEAMKRRKNS